MFDKDTVVVGGITGLIGAAIVAVGNAVGFSGRLGKVETAIKDINENCVTLLRCDEKIEASKELVGLQLTHHSEQIGEVKEQIEKVRIAQERGTKEILEKLDGMKKRQI